MRGILLPILCSLSLFSFSHLFVALAAYAPGSDRFLQDVAVDGSCEDVYLICVLTCDAEIVRVTYAARSSHSAASFSCIHAIYFWQHAATDSSHILRSGQCKHGVSGSHRQNSSISPHNGQVILPSPCPSASPCAAFRSRDRSYGPRTHISSSLPGCLCNTCIRRIFRTCQSFLSP